MASLFEDTLFDERAKNWSKKIKCKGCICELLQQLSNQSLFNFCSTTSPKLLIKNKGTSKPVSMDGSSTPTQFTLERFDPNTCCAIFSFEEIVDTSPLKTVRTTFIEDCHNIAGIACVKTDSDQLLI